MDRKLPVISLLSLAIAAALSGCGGSDNSQYTSTKSLSIKAIDGYLQYADVWLDLDGDNIQDSNEPSAVSDGTGGATLDVSRISNPASYRVLVKATAGKTIDLDTGSTVTSSFAMIAPAAFHHRRHSGIASDHTGSPVYGIPWPQHLRGTGQGSRRSEASSG